MKKINRHSKKIAGISRTSKTHALVGDSQMIFTSQFRWVMSRSIQKTRKRKTMLFRNFLEIAGSFLNFLFKNINVLLAMLKYLADI